MKIYLDACCYSRPFDNIDHMAQPRVKAEVAAVMDAVNICGVEGFSIVGSPAAVYEIGEIKNDDKRQKTMDFYLDTITVETPLTAAVKKRAAELMARDVKELDAYHVSLAESVGVDYLLTTDDRLEAAAVRLDVKIKVVNPIHFLQRYAVWLQSLTRQTR
jgi:predicted nucleic acid-binding protein